MKHSWLACTTLSLIIAGCSSTSPTAATNDDYDDVAQALSGVVATSDHGGEAGSFYDATQISIGAPVLGLAVTSSGQLAGKHGSLAYSYDANCKDSSGAAMPTCDLTTDAATVKVSWSGDLNTPNLTAAITHQGELQLTDIRSGTARISGDGSFDFDAHFQSAWRHTERDYHLGYTVSYDSVQVRRTPLLIIGGAIHYKVSADRMSSSDSNQVAASFRIHADLDFAADGSATLTLDGTRHYSIDMVSGLIAKR